MSAPKAISAGAIAMVSALASIACCLPFGFAVALGAAGAGLFLQTLRPWFLAISVLLVGLGFWQQRRATQCRKEGRTLATVLLWIACAIIISMTLFPQVIAGFIADLSGAAQ